MPVSTSYLVTVGRIPLVRVPRTIPNDQHYPHRQCYNFDPMHDLASLVPMMVIAALHKSGNNITGASCDVADRERRGSNQARVSSRDYGTVPRQLRIWCLVFPSPPACVGNIILFHAQSWSLTRSFPCLLACKLTHQTRHTISQTCPCRRQHGKCGTQHLVADELYPSTRPM